MSKIFIISIFVLASLYGKELFTKEHIFKYLSLDNPFVYVAVGEKFIAKQKENYQRGSFDTKILAKFDKKDYPVTKGEFHNIGLSKPIENGMEFSANYRKAEGIQEYNNIKTGDNGEVLLGIKIPVFDVVNDSNIRTVNLNIARLNTKEIDFKSQDNLRILYFEIISSYYKLLYRYERNFLISELLKNAQKRVKIIKKRSEAGSVSKLSYIEAQQQIINRKQLLVSGQNTFDNALEVFVKYLNIKSDYFTHVYELPLLSDVKKTYIAQDISLNKALRNRPDMQMFKIQVKKLDEQNNYVKTMQYPKFDVGIYGVHDFENDNGFKITLDLNFPIQRRQYLSKNIEIKKSIQNINQRQEQKRIMIKTQLYVIENSKNALEQNINNSILEIGLVEQLEAAEKRKYNLGLSNLFMVNQREMYTLHIKKKLLDYRVEYLLLEQELNMVMGESFIGKDGG